MENQIRADQIPNSSRNTKILLSLSFFGMKRKGQLLYHALGGLNGFMAVIILSYSTYRYIEKIDWVAVMIHHGILCLDVSICAGLGYFLRDQMEGLLEGAHFSYNYDSPMMLSKMNQVKEASGKNLRRMFKYLAISYLYYVFNIATLAACERFLFGHMSTLLVFPCWFPFSLDNILLHAVALLWEMSIVVQVGFIVFGSLGLFHYVYKHIQTEVELLNYALSNVGERALEMAEKKWGYPKENVGDEILKRCYIKCTRMCAQHHSNIIRYFNNGSIIVQIIYSLVFLSGLVVCSCAGFALISNNAALKIKFTGNTFIQLIYLFMMYWVAEALAEESLKVKDTIYGLDWNSFPRECKSILMIMMIRANQPLVSRMLTGQVIDLEGYMSLVKASYSYFNMMLAVTE